MQVIKLGRTGLEVSRLCLGCMSYGDPGWRPWVLDEAAAVADDVQRQQIEGQTLAGLIDNAVFSGELPRAIALAPRLRGLVDVYDGARHILQALIIATTEENGRLVCSFKRSNTVRDSAPLDYERDEDAPVGYLPKA